MDTRSVVDSVDDSDSLPEFPRSRTYLGEVHGENKRKPLLLRAFRGATNAEILPYIKANTKSGRGELIDNWSLLIFTRFSWLM
jgi:hypothetical protein